MKMPGPALRSAIPLAVLLVPLAAAVVLGFFLRGGPDEPRDDGGADDPAHVAAGGAPAWLAPADRVTLLGYRSRLRETLGEDAGAIDGVRDLLPAVPSRAVELLRFLRPELDLAVRSADARAARAALRLLGAALERGGAEVATLLQSTAFRNLYRRALESELPEVRKAGVLFLGKVGGPEIRRLVARSLADDDPSVRRAAVRVYGDHAESAGAARLISHFAGEADAGVRTEVLGVFGRRQELRTAGARALERGALGDGTEAERIQTLSNLALHRDHDALEAVLALLADGSRTLREKALQTVGFLRDRRAIPALERHAEEEPDPALRKLAADTLAALR
jgi:HEAT repeat protein